MLMHFSLRFDMTQCVMLSREYSHLMAKCSEINEFVWVGWWQPHSPAKRAPWLGGSSWEHRAAGKHEVTSEEAVVASCGPAKTAFWPCCSHVVGLYSCSACSSQ